MGLKNNLLDGDILIMSVVLKTRLKLVSGRVCECAIWIMSSFLKNWLIIDIILLDIMVEIV